VFVEPRPFASRTAAQPQRVEELLDVSCPEIMERLAERVIVSSYLVGSRFEVERSRTFDVEMPISL